MPWWFFRQRRETNASATPVDPVRPASRPEVSETLQQGSSASRRYLDEQPYLLPKDLGEVNRLDFQHYVLRSALRGNYLAPIVQPRRILDVGCGTGQWAFELAQQFPQAEVIGLDLEPAKAKATTPPANYRFVQGDALKGLPFENETFDFVHQRLLVLAIPLAAWPNVVQELARVTVPGGWVELVEAGTHVSHFNPAGPATQQFLYLMGQLGALRGLDNEGGVLRFLDAYLRQAGLLQVNRQDIDIPLGDWGGRVGSLLSLDLREAGKAISSLIAARFQMPEQEVLALIEQAGQEWNTMRTRYHVVAAYGQKPYSS
ncbi:class I SAM-dependent methyltransferase [Thermogemmatispora carboxidivorans]|uniref:class I SAM-dependent methyltransferase n=1 Tax=Thermogemmatispora carboxidivorans TaxID=1382306 RepID=UPI00069A0A97|nr:class I SAM-dependent methyltransferase [Thermogemmatispora carboxidivorans]